MNHTEARNKIIEVFQTAWSTTGYPVVSYDGTIGNIPDGPRPWARVTVRHTTGGQVSLANHSGKKRFRRNGFVTVQLFSRPGDGLSELDSLANLIVRAYEEYTGIGHGVWFRNVRVNEAGQDGDWVQFNVIADFTYDQVH